MSHARIAVVGLGFGRGHVARAAQIEGADLVAVVDPIAPSGVAGLAGDPAYAAAFEVPHHASLADLLAQDVPDIVAIATPIHTHLPLARAALEAGATVLLEKPPTATLEEFHQLAQVQRATGRAVQIGFQARGARVLTEARRLIADGALGEIIGIEAVGAWVRTRSYYERAAWAGRRTLNGTAVMDGVVTNPLAHAVDLALLLAGAASAGDVVAARLDQWHAHAIEADDTSSLVVETSAGVTVAAALTLCASERQSPVVRVRGTSGVLEVFYQEGTALLTNGSGTRSLEGTGFVDPLENLVDHLRTGAELICPLESTGPFMRVLEQGRLGGEPRQIGETFLHWEGEGGEGHPVVHGIEEWCERAVREQATFSELGAPWT